MGFVCSYHFSSYLLYKLYILYLCCFKFCFFVVILHFTYSSFNLFFSVFLFCLLKKKTFVSKILLNTAMKHTTCLDLKKESKNIYEGSCRSYLSLSPSL